MNQYSSQGAPEQGAPVAVVPGVLVFVFADLVVFGMLFMGFMTERRNQLDLFNHSAAMLNVPLGLLNTLILISSGMLMVLTVNAARHRDAQRARRLLVATMAVGAGFGVTKLIEYSDKFAHGINMLSNDFFMFYFVLTGAHFLHFVGGMAILAVLWFRIAREPLDGPLFHWLESGALYWHMVDLLWIVIFPMLYLMGPK